MRRPLLTFNLLSPLALAGFWLAGHIWWGAALVFAGHMAMLWATLHPRCPWFGPIYTAIPGREREIIFTFDDGPDPTDTPLILDLLRQHRRRAIFFVIGAKARQHPELIQRILAEGHDIGNHSLTHPQFSFWRLGPRRLREEIAGCSVVLQDLCGKPPRWFRPPVGHKNPFLHPILKSLGLDLLSWTARGCDGVRNDSRKILRALLPDIRPGATILLHEGRLTSGGYPLIAETLPAALEAAAKFGTTG